MTSIRMSTMSMCGSCRPSTRCGQLEQPVFAGLRRWRSSRARAWPSRGCTAAPASFAAHDRDVPSVVPRGLVLLVGRLVLLVDDDQPQVPDRGEDGRAGPDDDPRLAGGEREPAVEPLALAQVAVPDDAPVARGDRGEPGPQPGDALRGQRDLGNEVDRRFRRPGAPRRSLAGRPPSCPSRSPRGGARPRSPRRPSRRRAGPRPPPARR